MTEEVFDECRSLKRKGEERYSEGKRLKKAHRPRGFERSMEKLKVSVLARLQPVCPAGGLEPGPGKHLSSVPFKFRNQTFFPWVLDGPYSCLLPSDRNYAKPLVLLWQLQSVGRGSRIQY